MSMALGVHGAGVATAVLIVLSLLLSSAVVAAETEEDAQHAYYGRVPSFMLFTSETDTHSVALTVPIRGIHVLRIGLVSGGPTIVPGFSARLTPVSDPSAEPIAVHFDTRFGDVLTTARLDATLVKAVGNVFLPTPGDWNVLLTATHSANNTVPDTLVKFVQLDPAPQLFAAPSSCFVRQESSELCSLRNAAKANIANCDFAGPPANVLPTVAIGSSITGCAASAGEALNVTAPSTGAFSGAVLHFAREVVTTPLMKTVKSFDLILNNRVGGSNVEIRMEPNGIALYQVDVMPNLRVSEFYLFGMKRLNLDSNELKFESAAGSNSANRVAGVRFSNCAATLVDADNEPTEFQLFYPEDIKPCRRPGNSPLNSIYVHYTNGFIERAGAIRRFRGVDVHFIPANLTQISASNHSTCSGVAIGALPNLTTFPTAAIVPFRAGLTTSRIEIRVADVAERAVLIGASWIRSTGVGCVAPFKYDTAYHGYTVWGARSPATVDQPSGNSPHDCLLYGNSATLTTFPRAGLTAEHLATGSVGANPDFGCTFDDADLDIASNPAVLGMGDFSGGIFYTGNSQGRTMGYTTNHRLQLVSLPSGTYQPSLNRVLFTSTTGRLYVQNTSHVALAVPSAAFPTQDEWVALVGPDMSAQCGRGFDPFNDLSVFGAIVQTCPASVGYITCGETHYAESKSGVLAFYGPSQLGENVRCDDPFHAILVFDGDVAPPDDAPWAYDVNNPLLTDEFLDENQLIKEKSASFGSDSAIVLSRVNWDAVSEPRWNEDLVFCDFKDLAGYRAFAELVSPGSCVTPAGVTSVGQLGRMCDVDPTCFGFITYTPSESESDLPGCLVYDDSNLAAQTNATYWLRRAYGERECTFTARKPYGFVTVTAAMIDLAPASHTVEIRVNGHAIGGCGGLFGMPDGSDGQSGQCAATATCLEKNVIIAQGDSVSVVVPGSMTSQGECAAAAQILLDMSPTSSEAVAALATLRNRRNVAFDAAKNSTVTIRANPTKLAFQTTWTGCKTCPPVLSVFVSDTPQAGSDTSSSASSSLNNLVLQCGGSAPYGRPDLEDEELECGTPIVCTFQDTGSSETELLLHSFPGIDDLDAAFVTLAFSPLTNPSESCIGAQFRGTLLSDGAMLTAVDGAYGRTYAVDLESATEAEALARLQQELDAGITADDIQFFPGTFALPVVGNGDTITDLAEVILFDAPTWVENDKRLSAEYNPSNTFVGLLDAFTSLSDTVTWRIPVGSMNYLDVKVQQTIFLDRQAKVTVTVGPRTVTCGAGRTFRGMTGDYDECESWYTCYSGPISGDTNAAYVTVTPPNDRTPSTCETTVAVVAEVSNQLYTLSPCPSGHLYCPRHADDPCIPPEYLCDGESDCPDATDEAFCDHWTVSSRNVKPECADWQTNTMSVPESGVLELHDCKLWAAASYDSFQFTPSFVFVENKLCTAFTCMNLDNPSAVLRPFTLPEERRPVELYAYLEDANDFSLCSAALHCHGNGVPRSVKPPCACQCDENHIGTTCDTKRSMEVVAGVIVAVRPRTQTTTSLDLGVAYAVQDVLGVAIDYKYDVSLRSTTKVGTDYRLDISVTDSYATSQQLGSARLLMMQATTLDALRGALKEYDVDLVDVGSPSLFDASAKTIASMVPWDGATRRRQLTEGATLLSFTTVAAPVEGTAAAFAARSAAIPAAAVITGIDFTLLGGHYPTKNFRLLAGDCAEVTLTTDPTASKKCAQRTTCTYLLSTPQPATDATTGLPFSIDFTKEVLDSFTGDTGLRGCAEGLYASQNPTIIEPLQVAFTYTIPLAESAVPDGQRIEASSRLSTAAKMGLFIAMGLALFTLICASCCYHFFNKASLRTPEVDRLDRNSMLRNNWCLSTLGYTAALLAVAFAAIAAGERELISSHALVMDEYRSPLCDSSSLTPLPSRSARVIADDQCQQAEVLGASEGLLFMRARCVSAGVQGTSDGVIQVAIGDTKRACEESPFFRVKTDSCVSEAALFPYKVPTELQHLRLRCFTKAEADARFAVLANKMSPLLQPTEAVIPTPTPRASTIDTDDGHTVLYHVANPVRMSKMESRGGTSVAMAAYKNKDISKLYVLSDANARLEVVNYTDPSNVTYPAALSRPEEESDGLSSLGTIFNGFGQFDEVSGFQTASGAFHYQGVDNVDLLNIGARLKTARNAVTIAFWMKASRTTRGFPFIVSDYWHARDSYASPIMERLITIIESGRAPESSYFQQQWKAYYAVYVSGVSKSIHLITAQPSGGTQVNGSVMQAGEDNIMELVFDLDNPAMQLTRVFDGNWHFIAVALPSFSSRRYAQLFVDGETSYTKQGWRQCFPKGTSMPAFDPVPLETEAPVFSAINENVRGGVVAYVGHFNGGVYNVEVHDGFLEQERIIGYGSIGMKQYAIIDKDRATMLAIANFAVAGAGFLLAVILLIVAGVRQRLESDPWNLRDPRLFFHMLRSVIWIRDLHEIPGFSARTVASALPGFDVAGHIASRGPRSQMPALPPPSSIRGSELLSVFLKLVLNVIQIMGLYVSGWRWPVKFSAPWYTLSIPFSFDFGYVGVDALVGPLVLFALASLLLLFLIYLGARDRGRFKHKVLVRAQHFRHGLVYRDSEFPAPRNNTVRPHNISHTLVASKYTGVSHKLLEVTLADREKMKQAIKAAHDASATGGPRVSQTLTITAWVDGSKREEPPVPEDFIDETIVTKPANPIVEQEPNEPMADLDASAHTQVVRRERRPHEPLPQLPAEPLENIEGCEKITVSGIVYLQTAGEAKIAKNAARESKRSRAPDSELKKPDGSPKDDAELCKEEDMTYKAYFVTNTRVATFVASTPTKMKTVRGAYALESTVEWPAICPKHHMRLIKASRSIHPAVLLDNGHAPYVCCMQRESKWYAFLHKERHACSNIFDAEFYLCPEDDCNFCVCDHCAELSAVERARADAAGKLYESKRTGGVGVVGMIALTLLLLIFLPLLRHVLMILVCHPEYQCEFPGCYNDLTGLFAIAVIYSIVTVGFLFFFFLCCLIANLGLRKIQACDSGALDGSFKRGCPAVVDPEYKPEGIVAKLFADCDNAAWQDVLRFDATMLSSLYAGYSFRFMTLMGPLDLIFKLLLVLPIILADPNSLEQIFGASIVEVSLLVFLLMTNAFVNQWVNLLAHLGSLHQILLLGFMALHRVAVNEDPDSVGYTDAMIAVSASFLGCVALLFLKVILIPTLTDAHARAKSWEDRLQDADVKAFKSTGAQDTSTTVEKVAESSIECLLDKL
jgi:hypothetical protein